MKINRLAYITALILLMVSISLIAFRYYHMRQKKKDAPLNGWKISISAMMTSNRSDSKTTLFLPDDQNSFYVYKEKIANQNLLYEVVKKGKDAGRMVVGVPIFKKKPYHFRGDFYITRQSVRVKKRPITNQIRERALKHETAIQTEHPFIQAYAEKFIEENHNKKELLNAIFHFCSEEIKHRNNSLIIDARNAIEMKEGSTIARVRAMIALCRSAKIPARMVTGLVLSQEYTQKKLHHWVEVIHQKQWQPFDPLYGYAFRVPDSFYPIIRNHPNMVMTDEGTHFEISHDVSFFPHPFNASDNLKNPSEIFNLMRLPIGMRHTLSIILLLPFGALITAIFRNIIGLTAFGTFTPALVSLSFVLSDFRTGIIIFIAVFLTGLSGRLLLDRLKLLMVPRLGCILTGVIGLMTLLISVLDFYHLTPSTHAVLLPSVIIVMMIERYVITEKEDGLLHAVKLSFHTAIISLVCFLLLKSDYLREWILYFPETLLMVLAALIVIGRYTGYRIMELFRFKSMIEQENAS